MKDISFIGNPISQRVLENFKECATQGEELRVAVDGQSYKVLAQGAIINPSGIRRSIAWVQCDDDTTSIFVKAMSQSYGTRVSDSIAKELGLEPSPGKPLASRLVQQALEMAKVSQQVLEGVDFITALEHSAVSIGRSFNRALSDLNLDHKSLTGETRMEVDAQMKAKFSEANANGNSPVTAEVASIWLKAILLSQFPRPISVVQDNGTP
jgi:hypothetical protein